MSAPSPSAPSTPSRGSAEDAGRLVRQATTLSVAVAITLIALKAFALGASGSVSILASLADSALDMAGSLGAFFAVRWASQPPDADHRHGHGKAEALSALVQAGLVFASALFIGWEAISRIIEPRPVTAGGWAAGVVVLSVVVTLWLLRVQTGAIKRSGSLAVAGDRAHYLADLGANAVVLIGVISGAYLKAPALDAAAGLIVVVWLFWGAAGILRPAASQLLDRDLGEAVRAPIVAAVLSDARIRGVHRLRTRASGSTTLIEMHIDLDAALTLETAHAIVVEAEQRVTAIQPGAEVIIHADPRRLARAAVPESTACDADPDPASPPSDGGSVVPGPWSR